MGKKARKRTALQQRMTNALLPSSAYAGATLDAFADLPTSGEYLTGMKGKQRYMAADKFAEFANTSGARVHERLADAMWADSAGNPASRFGQLEQRMLAEGAPTAAMTGLERSVAAARATQATNSAFGTANRQIRATGIKQDGTELADTTRRRSLASILNRVDAQNNAMRAADGRRAMVRDYAFDAEGNTVNAAAGGAASVAAAQEADRQRKKGKDASASAGRTQLAGTAAGLAISAFSHSSFKTDVTQIGDKSILAGLRELNIARWRYQGESTVHIGPMAEDFHRIFGVGDGVTLHLVDVMGVALGALKELAAAAGKD